MRKEGKKDSKEGRKTTNRRLFLLRFSVDMCMLYCQTFSHVMAFPVRSQVLLPLRNMRRALIPCIFYIIICHWCFAVLPFSRNVLTAGMFALKRCSSVE